MDTSANTRSGQVCPISERPVAPSLALPTTVMPQPHRSIIVWRLRTSSGSSSMITTRITGQLLLSVVFHHDLDQRSTQFLVPQDLKPELLTVLQFQPDV